MKKAFLIYCLLNFSMIVYSQNNCFEKNYNNGIEAFKNKEFEKAYSCFKAAKYGCPDFIDNTDIDNWLMQCKDSVIHLIEIQKTQTEQVLIELEKKRYRNAKLLSYIDFSENRAWIQTNDTAYLINNKGDLIKAFPNNDILDFGSFANGIAILSTKKYWLSREKVIIDTTGYKKKTCQYLSDFYNDYAFAVCNDTSYLLNKQGNEVLKSSSKNKYHNSCDSIVEYDDLFYIIDYITEYPSFENNEGTLFFKSGVFFEGNFDELQFYDKYTLAHFYIEKSYNEKYDSTLLYSKHGEIILKAKEIDICNNGHYILKNNKYASLLNSQFQVISDSTYSEISEIGFDNYLKVRTNKGWGVIDTLGNEIIEPQFDEINSLGIGHKNVTPINSYFTIKTSTGWGVVNTTGKVIITPKYQEIEVNDYNNDNLFDGYFEVTTLTGRGIVDTLNNILIPPVYGSVIDICNGSSFIVSKKQSLIIYDYVKKKEIFEGKNIKRGTEGYIPVTKNGKEWFYINYNGIKLTDQIFSYTGNFKKGYAKVCIADTSNYAHKIGYIDKTGKFHADNFKKIYDFSEGLAYADFYDNAGGYIDSTGAKVTPLIFHVNKAKPFSEEFAALYIVHSYPNNERYWYYINKRGERAFEGSFDEAGNFENGKAKVRIGKEWFYIDNAGKRIDSNQMNKIKK